MAQPRVTALAIATKVMMALTGVRRTGCTLPIHLGSRPSRPALKISRHCEFTAAMSTPRVEVSPAMYAMKVSGVATLWATVMNGIAAAASDVALYLKPETVA